jgi:uncharacterized protein
MVQAKHAPRRQRSATTASLVAALRGSRQRRGYKSTIDPGYVVSNMTLQERVDSDLKDAMRAKATIKLGVLRMLKSALKYAAIAKSGTEAELSDTETAQVIRKQVKQRQDSIESFEKASRTELVEKEKEELSILNEYLPQPMSADEISKVVRETIAETGATSRAQMGAVMKALQAKVAGRVDGKALSAEVQKQLSS